MARYFLQTGIFQKSSRASLTLKGCSGNILSASRDKGLLAVCV